MQRTQQKIPLTMRATLKMGIVLAVAGLLGVWAGVTIALKIGGVI